MGQNPVQVGEVAAVTEPNTSEMNSDTEEENTIFTSPDLSLFHLSSSCKHTFSFSTGIQQYEHI